MEDLPNLLQRDYGLKPQGKSAPMSAHRSSAGISTSGGGRMNVYDDVFGGPPKFTAPSFASQSQEGYDDIFRSFSTSAKASSVPVFDAPVYDDDIFGGIKGVRSATVTYDDVFSGGSGGPSAASFEDLLGEFGGSGKSSARSNLQRSDNQGDSGFEDLIPGFGNSEPAKKNRSAVETKPKQRVSSVLSAGSPLKPAEDPFVVLEPEPLSSNASSTLLSDPLEQFSMPSQSSSTKERKVSSNGATGAGIDGINAFDGFPLGGPAVSSPMNKPRMANSPLKANHSSSPTHRSGNKESVDVKSARKTSLNNHPVKDYSKPHAGVPRADVRKSSGHSNITSKINSPRRHRQPLHENTTYVGNLNLQGSLPVMKSQKGANFIDEVLVTVAEIKLLTQPTALPPPSRPPPPLVIKQGPSSKKTLDSKAAGNSDRAGNSNEFPIYQKHPQSHQYGKASGNSAINELEDFVSGGPRARNEVGSGFPSPSMDEEQVESSSGAVALAAAMKDAMERAEARLKLAKEARERKREDAEREEKAGKSKEKERNERRDARAVQEAREREEKEREVKAAREAREREEREREELERERKQREREREREKEREREREREREKDRLAVERATQEARERASAEARERAERAAVERATTEARERAAAEARERAEKIAVERAAAEARERAAAEARERVAAEKAAAEARERAVAEARERAEKIAVERAAAEARERAAAEARERAAAERAAAEARERAVAEARERAAARAAAERAAAEARLRAERAAVERANSEARERAAERAAVEKAASVAKERAERAVSAARERQRRNENDLESFFGVGARPNSAPRQRPPTSDGTSDAQSQNRGFSNEGFQKVPTGTAPGFRQSNLASNMADDWTSLFTVSSSEEFQEIDGESAERRKARLERHQRTLERAAKALAEKNDRDLQAQREQAERHRLAETLDADVKRWATGKEGNLRALLSTLQYVLWAESGWQPVSLTDVITAASVKKVYRKATLCVHPDKVQQKGATLQQKYIAEKVFDLLKDAWNKFSAEELF